MPKPTHPGYRDPIDQHQEAQRAEYLKRVAANRELRALEQADLEAGQEILRLTNELSNLRHERRFTRLMEYVRETLARNAAVVSLWRELGDIVNAHRPAPGIISRLNAKLQGESIDYPSLKTIEQRFDELFPGHVTSLIARAGSLSVRERTICRLVGLQLSIESIALLLAVDEETLHRRLSAIATRLRIPKGIMVLDELSRT